MVGLAHRTVSQLLEDVAAPRPAPGGGSSAALTCALAAALVEMAAQLALGRPTAPARPPDDVPDRARALRLRALGLADQELSSYGPVLEAMRLPADDPARPARLEAALTEASRAPLAIAEAAAETAVLAARTASASGQAVYGDGLTAVMLAEAATAAAAALVEINLEAIGGEVVLDRAREARRRAREARERALASRPPT